MLVYREVDDLQVIGYADADLAGCTDDRKSTIGFSFTLAGGEISWKISKQRWWLLLQWKLKLLLVMKLVLMLSG